MVWVGSQQQGISEFVAVNTQANSEWITAEVMGKVPNQNLHALRNIDYVIICGDFGGVWNKDEESNTETMLLDWLECKPFTTLFVDGNHEGFDFLFDYRRQSP